MLPAPVTENSVIPMGLREFKLFRALVHERTGIWLRDGKQIMLASRLSRRLRLHGLTNFADYFSFVQNVQDNGEEIRELINCVTTNKTSFFRERHHFDFLAGTVVPQLQSAAQQGGARSIRVWSAASSTGEEAYSLAICLTEFLEDAKVSVPFEIFATDISEAAIEKARAGAYAPAAVAHVSPQRLGRFFTRSERGYRVAKIIRDACVFARHNVGQDPPFSKLDLISCCNVLIYLGSVLQHKVLSILRYALKPTGFLVLGPSEGVGPFSEWFQQVDSIHKIYRMQPAAGAPAPRTSEGRRAGGRVDLPRRIAGGRAEMEVPQP